jgi:hypothetical protein
MNKGLAVHIIVTIIYALLILYVLDGVKVDLEGRAFITYLALMVNLFTVIFCDDNEWYDQKIK